MVLSDFRAQENKICHFFPLFPLSICPEMMEADAMILVFLILRFKTVFHSLSPSSRCFLVSLHFQSLEWHHLHIWGYFKDIFLRVIQLLISREASTPCSDFFILCAVGQL